MANSDYDLEGFLRAANEHKSVYQQALDRMAERFEKVVNPPKPIPPSQWLQTYFYVPRPRNPKTGDVLPPGPIVLDDHQAAIVDEALSRDEGGRFRYVTILYSAPKKSGKSALSAGVAKYMGHTNDYGSIYCLANDGKQSDDRLYQPIVKSYSLHRRLNGPFAGVRPKLVEVTIPDTHSKIEAVPCDAAGEAGSEPLATFWSEVWGYDSEAKRRLFTEMTVPPTLYGYAIRWIESYAGFIGQSDLLWELYETGVKQGTPHPGFNHLVGIDGEPVVYVNEAARMFVYWDTKPRMAWQTDDYYEAEARILLPSEFQRIHRNQWQAPSGSFVEPEMWDRCADPHLPPLVDKRVPCVIAIDAAVSKDCAAILLLTRDPNYPETDVAIRKARIFRPSEGRKLNLENTIGRTLRDWLGEHNVVCVVYDEFQMAHLIQNYSRGKVIIDGEELRDIPEDKRDAYIMEQQRVVQVWYEAFGQQNPRAIADKQLHDLITNRQIHYNPHDLNEDIGTRGDQETVTKHIKQAGTHIQGDNKLRLAKLSPSAHIDGAVALAMGAHQVLKLNMDNEEFDVDNAAQQLARGDITFEDFQTIMSQRRARLVRDTNDD